MYRMVERTIGSEGVHEEERGGSPGSGPTPVKSKDVDGVCVCGGEDGGGTDQLCIIHQKGRRQNAEAFPDRPDWIYAGLGVTGGGVERGVGWGVCA